MKWNRNATHADWYPNLTSFPTVLATYGYNLPYQAPRNPGHPRDPWASLGIPRHPYCLCNKQLLWYLFCTLRQPMPTSQWVPPRYIIPSMGLAGCLNSSCSSVFSTGRGVLPRPFPFLRSRRTAPFLRPGATIPRPAT